MGGLPMQCLRRAAGVAAPDGHRPTSHKFAERSDGVSGRRQVAGGAGMRARFRPTSRGGHAVQGGATPSRGPDHGGWVDAIVEPPQPGMV